MPCESVLHPIFCASSNFADDDPFIPRPFRWYKSLNSTFGACLIFPPKGVSFHDYEVWISTMGSHVSFIFMDSHPYLWGCKTLHGFPMGSEGVQGIQVWWPNPETTLRPIGTPSASIALAPWYVWRALATWSGTLRMWCVVAVRLGHGAGHTPYHSCQMAKGKRLSTRLGWILFIYVYMYIYTYIICVCIYIYTYILSE